jgi:hypothetical protein
VQAEKDTESAQGAAVDLAAAVPRQEAKTRRAFAGKALGRSYEGISRSCPTKGLRIKEGRRVSGAPLCPPPPVSFYSARSVALKLGLLAGLKPLFQMKCCIVSKTLVYPYRVKFFVSKLTSRSYLLGCSCSIAPNPTLIDDASPKDHRERKNVPP